MIEGVDLLVPMLAIVIAASSIQFQRRWTDAMHWVALHSSLVGGIAAAIGTVELLRAAAAAAAAAGLIEVERAAADFGPLRALLAVVGTLIGGALLTGALLALGRLRGLIGVGSVRAPRVLGPLMLSAACLLGTMIVFQLDERLIVALIVVSLILGVGAALAPASAGLPRVVWIGDAMAGLALASQGFVLRSPALFLAGTVVGVMGALALRVTPGFTVNQTRGQ